MKLLKNASNKTLSILLSVFIVLSMLPIGVFTTFALAQTALETDIAEKVFYTDNATEFTFTTTAIDEDAGKMVLGSFVLLNENGEDAQAAVQTLEYWDVTNGCYREFYGDFGPADTGFPLTNGATSQFRVTFKDAGTYKIVASMLNFADRSVLVSTEETITVKPFSSELTTDIDSKSFVNNAEVEFTYTTIANGQAGTIVLGTFSVLDGESQDAMSCVKKLEYLDVADGTFKEFYGDFGPADTGFPLTDATSTFRVTFSKPGTYTVNAAIKKFDDGTVLCSNTKTITVQPNSALLETDIHEKLFEINEHVEFTYTTVANDFAGTYVLGTFTVNDKNGDDAKNSVAKLEYLDVADGNLKEFYGDFGPADTGFPLTDATSTFRVTFSKPGEYTVVAKMVTFDGRETVCEKETKIEVKDTLAPEITDVTGYEEVWTAAGFVLTVVANDNSGKVAEYSKDGITWQASKEFNITENGTYKFYAKDAAGNVSSASAEVVVSHIDRTAPEVGVITLDPDGWTKDTIEINVPAEDKGVGKVLYKIDDKEWQEASTFNIKDAVKHTIYVKDSLGNEATPIEIVADKYDDVAPVINSVSVEPNTWVNDKVAVTVDAIDAGVSAEENNGSIAYSKDGITWQVSNVFEFTENGTYTLYVKDLLDNISQENVTISKIDKEKPVIDNFASSIPSGTWTNQNVVISGKVNDNGKSGVVKLEFTTDNQIWTELTFGADGSFQKEITDECNTTYSFRCVDAAGNISEEVYSIDVKIDKTAPAISVNEFNDTWKDGQFGITGKVVDAASGIKSSTYTNSNDPADAGDLVFTGDDFKFTTNVSESGEYTYKVVVADIAGNTAEYADIDVKIDLVAPVVSITKDNVWVNTAVNEIVIATDEVNGSGISGVYYREVNAPQTELSTQIPLVDGQYKLSLPAADNNKKYYVYCVDNSGKESARSEYTARIDVTKPEKPVIEYSKTLGYKLIDLLTFGLYQSPVTVTISSADTLSGLDNITYYLDNEKKSETPNAENKIIFTVEPDNQKIISAIAFDKAGNSSEEQSEGSDIPSGGTNDEINGVIVDATKPVVDSFAVFTADGVAYDGTFWTSQAIKVTGVVSDKLAGVAKVYWKQGPTGEEQSATLNADGTYEFDVPAQSYAGKIYIGSYDLSGNKADEKDVDVLMDNVNPEIVKIESFTADGQVYPKYNGDELVWTNQIIKVKVTASDNLSGVAKVYWKQGPTGEEQSATLNADGTYEFEISVRDYEGLIFVGCYDATNNKADEKDTPVRMDTTKPVVTELKATTIDGITYTGDWTNQTITLTGKVTDPEVKGVVSGVVAVKYAYDDVEGLATYDAVNGTYTFEIPAKNYNFDGVVEVWCEDAAGSESDKETARVRLDTTKPTVDSGKAESAEWTDQVVVISGMVSDKTVNESVSMVKTVMYKYNDGEDKVASFNNNSNKYTIEIPAQNYKGDVTIWCIDHAGNVSDDFAVSVKMDIDNPTDVKITYSESVISKIINTITFGFYRMPLNVTISAKDNLALEKIEYTVVGVEGEFAPKDVSTHDTVTIVSDATNEAGDIISGHISFSVPAEFKGKINAIAYDRAGNSTAQVENNKGFGQVIVDSIAPVIDVTYTANDTTNTKVQFVDANNATVEKFDNATQVLYNGDATATITITESNFFEGKEYTDEEGKPTGNVVHEVGLLVTKTDNDGNVTKTEYLPKAAAKLFEDATETVEFSWETKGNVHTYTVPYNSDADYVITVKYADFSKNEAEITSNDGISAKNVYVSKVVTIDKIAPVVTVEYANNDIRSTIGARNYFTEDQFATITVTEHNFRADDFKAEIIAKYSNDTDVVVADFAAKLADDSAWKKNGNVYTINLDYVVDANYTFDYTYEDLAHNKAAGYVADEFTVDKMNPETPLVKYDGDVKTTVIDKILNVITFGFYDAKVKVTISAFDSVSGIDHFMYSYTKGNGVSGVNASLENVVIEGSQIIREDKTFIATFDIPKDVLHDSNQFNGTVSFTAYDRATRSTSHQETANIIVDNIKPVATVTFSEPVQNANNVSYYSGDINATIVINEANFYSEDVNVVVTKDGAVYPVAVNWVANSVDVHTGTFILTEDGDYVLDIKYLDRSMNEMVPYTSNQLTIDTKDPVINVSNISHQSANNGETIGFTVSVTDTNIPLNNFRPTLRVVVRNQDADGNYVYETTNVALGNATTTVNAAGETVHSYTVTNLTADGFYSLECNAVDYANHSVSTINSASNQGGNAIVETVNFSVNREGSVFWIETEHNDKYSGKKFINELNGAYANDNVLVELHEVNVDVIDEENTTVFTLNDGSKSENITLVEGDNYSKNVIVGTGGWYETVYTLDNTVFDHDGVYSLNVITYDRAENSNINTKMEEGTIKFTLDRSKPEIFSNIKSRQSVNDTQFWVEFEIKEANLDAETVVVKLTDNKGNAVETEVIALGNGEYRFLVESGYNYNIEIVAKDLAGNESELYKVERFTVSTNILVLWYAHTTLFWGSIGGTLALAVAICIIVLLKKRKKEENK